MMLDMSKEYSEKFDELRKNRVAVSFYKYGPVAENYSNQYIDALGSMNKCVQKYKDTGNTEYLVDAANYLMFEYMFPQHKNAHFEATDSSQSAGIVGMGVREAERFAAGE